jgi:epoxyqueuosine reductase
MCLLLSAYAEVCRMDGPQLTAALKREAHSLGFALAGACPAVTPQGIGRFHQWLAAGYAGTMDYLPGRVQAYEHPEHVLTGARSLLVLAYNYRTVEPESPQPGRGRVSRYAWGADYHDVVRERLRRLADFLAARAPHARTRAVVDTAPLLEREFAQLAGLGWIGKNTLVLNTHEGSWFFLAALVTDVELAYDEPHEADHCGTCRACLDACPTSAFVDAYVLDARRCISYLTIELREPIPRELRPQMGNWLFGCDVCQEVCPWNHKAPTSDEQRFGPLAEMTTLDLAGLFELDDAAFRTRFRHTPLWRPKRRGLLRNAAIVLGNQRQPEALPALIRGVADAEPLVRGACAWALGRYEDDRARRALCERLSCETDSEVREEIEAALAGIA